MGFHLRELPATARRVRVCVDDRCRRIDAERDRRAVFVALDDVPRERTVRVRLRATLAGRDAPLDDEIAVPLRAERPNGPGCPPVCFQAAVRFDVQGRRLVEDRSLERP